MSTLTTPARSWTTDELLERLSRLHLAYLVVAAAGAVALGVALATVRLKVVAAVVAMMVGAGMALVRPDIGLLLLIIADTAELSRVVSSQSPFTAVRILGALIALSWLARGGAARTGRSLASPQFAFMVGYFLVAFSSLFYAAWPQLAEPILREYLMIVLLFVLVVALSTGPRQMRAVTWSLVVAALASMAIALRQYEPHMHRLATSQSNPNYFALNLVAVLPLALYLGIGERSRLLRLGALPAAVVMMWGIAKTFSRGAFLGLATVLVMVVVHLLGYPRRASRSLLLPVAGVVLVSALLMPSGYVDRIRSITAERPDASIWRRRETNKATWQMFLDHPLLGVGVGNSTRWSVVYRPEIGFVRAPHNIVLEVASETGLLGLACFAAALGYACWDLGRAARQFRGQGDWRMYAVCSAYLVGMTGFMVTALFKTATVVRILWLMVAMSVVARNLTRQPPGEAGP